MENRKNFQNIKVFRLFDNELEDMQKIITHAKDMDGLKKYQNESHFIRCAVVNLINDYKNKLNIKPGRPQKYNNGASKW